MRKKVPIILRSQHKDTLPSKFPLQTLYSRVYGDKYWNTLTMVSVLQLLGNSLSRPWCLNCPLNSLTTSARNGYFLISAHKHRLKKIARGTNRQYSFVCWYEIRDHYFTDSANWILILSFIRKLTKHFFYLLIRSFLPNLINHLWRCRISYGNDSTLTYINVHWRTLMYINVCNVWCTVIPLYISL